MEILNGLPCWLSKHRKDMGWISGLGKSPGEGNGNPLQYSCLGKPTDRGAWRATVHGVTKSDMTKHEHEYSIMQRSHLVYPSIRGHMGSSTFSVQFSSVQFSCSVMSDSATP